MTINYEVGDFIQLKKIKRKWRLPADTKFEIIHINSADATILTAIYKGEQYGVFAENIAKIYPKKEVVQFS